MSSPSGSLDSELNRTPSPRIGSSGWNPEKTATGGALTRRVCAGRNVDGPPSVLVSTAET
jgi:hypothetical protein